MISHQDLMLSVEFWWKLDSLWHPLCWWKAEQHCLPVIWRPESEP